METPCLAVERRSGNYKPAIWNDNFIQSITEDGKQVGDIKKTRKLKEEVREMIYGEKLLKDKLDLIDSLQQLGVAYHFKKDIKCVLTEIHESMDQILMSTSDDLHLISLLFRLLRFHGFSVSEDIFKNCMDNEDDLKAKLSSDIKATLSLYEASFLTKEGEEKLEMAKHVTTKYLTDFLQSSKNTDSRLKEHVAHALGFPLHGRGMERLHARWFIDQYKLYEHMRPAFMELAVLDFNLLQNAYKKELKETSRWWTDLQLHEKLSFIRDRIVESYLWSVSFVPEPKHANLRKVITKTISMISVIDDVYDVYGTLDELETFTHAVEQWDITSIEMLPELYMQLCLRALINMVHDDSDHVLKERGLRITPYLKKAWTDLCKAYLVEARWYHTKYQPTLEEYLENGWLSISIHVIFANAYCINDEVTANDLEELLHGYPNIVRVSSIAGRLYEDLGTSTAEMERGDVDKSIQCYMRDKRVTESAARQGINEMAWKCWKLLNSENVGDSAFHEYYRNFLLDLVRSTECFYEKGDGHGDPAGHETKERVISLLLEPIEI